MTQPKIGLALGGGVARGLAHIGVLQALSDIGIKIDMIAGTSSGSIMGALFAAGYPPNGIAQVACGTVWRDLGHLVVPRHSLLGADRLERRLETLLRGRSFADLRLPFAAICTDLYSAEKVVINSGPVSAAVRASCSIPGIFPPVTLEDKLLVDGSTVENVPVPTVREMGADFVIGVDLYADIAEVQQVEGIMGVLIRNLEITQRFHSQADSQQADICIEPKLAGESLIDLGKVDVYIQAGFDAAMACKEELLKLKQHTS
ncbi:MAG TPA: esterase [Firmicutes bacterium]|nr:esterase [Bacillota bacterium]